MSVTSVGSTSTPPLTLVTGSSVATAGNASSVGATSPLSDRCAYSGVAEVSVYVDPAARAGALTWSRSGVAVGDGVTGVTEADGIDVGVGFAVRVTVDGVTVAVAVAVAVDEGFWPIGGGLVLLGSVRVGLLVAGGCAGLEDRVGLVRVAL